MKKKRFARTTSKMMCGLSFALVLAAAAQDDDPFAADDDPFATYNPRIFRKGKASEVIKEQKEQVAVMIEMIEVDHLKANELMLAGSKKANDVGEMRAELIEMVKEGEAELVETLWGRSTLNQVAKIEATVEKIYATEYEPPKLPQIVMSGAGGKKVEGTTPATVAVTGDLYTGATPSAFDTRNTGTTLEFEAAESPEHPGKLGLSIFLEVVKYLQDDQFTVPGQEADARGTMNIVMPRFSSISQEFAMMVTPGKPTLLGIFKDGADDTETKRVVILMHAEMIVND